MMKIDAAIERILSILICLAMGSLTGSSAAPVQSDLSWVEKRVLELQPAGKEKRFDEIGWAKDIREAKRLAKEHRRPVFLFTHDGRMNIGRC